MRFTEQIALGNNTEFDYIGTWVFKLRAPQIWLVSIKGFRFM